MKQFSWERVSVFLRHKVNKELFYYKERALLLEDELRNAIAQRDKYHDWHSVAIDKIVELEKQLEDKK